MARLRPPGGRKAAAVVAETPDEVDDEIKAGGIDNVNETGDAESRENIGDNGDPTIALKAQIDALRKSEREALARADSERRRAEEALKRAQDRDAEVNKLQEQTVNSQKDAINAALSAAQAEAETAQREIESASSIGDAKGQAEAYRKLSRAEARVVALESGLESLEREIREKPRVPDGAESKVTTPDDPIEKINLPPLAKKWLRQHSEYLYDQRKNSKIQSLHWDVVDEGHEPYSQDYFESLEIKLGLREDPASDEDLDMEDRDHAPPARRPMVSAPPSREVPSSSGNRGGADRITLTAAQKEAAKISGLTEKEYSDQLRRLKQEKANGNYGGAP